MTAYDIFKRMYYHNMGHVMRRWIAYKGSISPKEYVMQSFIETLDKYTVGDGSSKYVYLEYCVEFD